MFLVSLSLSILYCDFTRLFSKFLNLHYEKVRGQCIFGLT